jgi:hypothetical protein
MEVSTVVGRPAPPVQVQETATGSTQCRWEWSDTGTIATASFADESAIRARATATKCCPNSNAQVVAQFFDYSLRVEQELGSDLPVPLTGVGQRAALFFDDVFLKLIVQRPDGVAQLVGANLPREQLLALGRALAAP